MVKQEVSRSLTDYVTSCGSQPFRWGTNDCVLFVCRWIQIRTGKNILEDLPMWHNQTSAHRLLRTVGGLEEVAIRRLGTTTTSPETGDVALVLPPHNCMGIVSSNGILVIGKSGLFKLGLPMAKLTWKI